MSAEYYNSLHLAEEQRITIVRHYSADAKTKRLIRKEDTYIIDQLMITLHAFVCQLAICQQQEQTIHAVPHLWQHVSPNITNAFRIFPSGFNADDLSIYHWSYLIAFEGAAVIVFDLIEKSRVPTLYSLRLTMEQSRMVETSRLSDQYLLRMLRPERQLFETAH